MTNRHSFRFCHLRDTSNIPIKWVEMGEWLREPVATGYSTGFAYEKPISPLGRTPSAEPDQIRGAETELTI